MKETQIELLSAPLGERSEHIRHAVSQAREAHGLAPVSPELWSWRLANPDGAHLGLALGPDGELQALVLGLAKRARLNGEDVRFMELVELTNEFSTAQGLARTQALDALCRAFAAEHGGRAPEGMPLFYGWPTRRAHRYLLSQQKAEVLRSEEFLAAGEPALKALVKPLAPGLELEELARLPEQLDEFFGRIADRYGATLVRDAKRLNWRFADHPEHDYRIAVVRRAGELVGYAVQRAGQAGLSLLADWSVLEGDLEAIDALLSWAAELSLEGDLCSLVFGVSTNSFEYRHLQGLGFDASDSSEYLLMRSFQKPFIMSWLFHNWFYTYGDLERG